MSEPFDARLLRSLVREAAGEEPPAPDWDALEDKLFARLDDAPTALSQALTSYEAGEGAGDSGEEETAVRLSELPALEGDRVSPTDSPIAAHAEARGYVHTPGGDPVELSAEPAEPAAAAPREKRASANEAVARSTDRPAGKRRAPITLRGGEKSRSISANDVMRDDEIAGAGSAIAFAEVDEDADARKSSAAIDSYHSPSLIMEAPKAGAARSTALGRRARVFGFLAVAAAIALVAGLVARQWGGTGPSASASTATIQEERWVDPVDVPMAPGLENVRDAGALKRGDVVEASQGAVVFGRKDKLTWTLAPGSRVKIDSEPTEVDSSQVVVLESGSIRALVSGDHRVDALVVRAGQARVSVDGASLPAQFTVTRSTRGLAVEVEEGWATLSSFETALKDSSSDAHMLGPRERATFSLDAREFKMLEPVAVNQQPAVPPISPVPTAILTGVVPSPVAPRNDSRPVDPKPSIDPHAPAAPSASAPATTPVAPAAEPPATSEASIRGALLSCIESTMAKHTSASGVSMSAESTVRFVVDAEGLIRSASFSPPLTPELQSCAVPFLRNKVDGGAHTIQVPVSITSH